jgi:hypothetical protein
MARMLLSCCHPSARCALDSSAISCSTLESEERMVDVQKLISILTGTVVLSMSSENSLA